MTNQDNVAHGLNVAGVDKVARQHQALEIWRWSIYPTSLINFSTHYLGSAATSRSCKELNL